MKKVILSAAALMCGAVMVAQSNTSDVLSQGDGNASIVSQTGTLNESDVDQIGDGNDGDVSQNGTSNSSMLYQLGNLNDSDVAQRGGNNGRDYTRAS